jgi:predicted DNA-binding transcriptional regulator YafY
MNRTDRLLAIVLELQGRGRRRAEDLAATFETSKRTIYRDITALCEAGVPIVATPGLGYSLTPGYFLPPLSFTAPEATLLLLGAEVMAGSFDTLYRRVAEAAGRKIEAVLPEQARDEARYLRDAIVFIRPAAAHEAAEALLPLIRACILERRRLRFRYFAPGADTAPAPREADPYGLAHYAGAWYMTGYAPARRAVRRFRIDRMEDVTALAETFSRPPGFAIRQGEAEDGRTVVVRALLDPAVARQAREAPSFYQVAAEPRAEGLLITLRVRDETDAVRWLLGWGAAVRAVEPDSLRARMAAEAEAMARNYRPPDPLLT